jgi:two-component system sensor histidine kinase ChiS
MADLKSIKFRSFFEGTFTIFFATTIAVVALIVWFFLYLINIEKYKIQTAMEMESTRLERALTDRVEHTFAIIKNINSQIAKNPSNKHINEILTRFKSSPELSDTFSWTIFSWANAQNKITVDSEYGIMKKPFDLSGRDYISFTKIDPQKFHLGMPVFGSTSKKWMIPGGVGAVDKNGKYLGALTIGFEINSLARSLHKAIQNYNVGFELLNNQGTPILYANNSAFGISENDEKKNLAPASMLDKAAATELGTYSDINLWKNEHGFLVKKLSNFPYFLFLKYDEKAIRNGVWKGLISRSVEIFFLFFISAFLLTLIYKKEQKQRQKILMLKHLIEKTNEAKMEFISQSAKEFKNFVFKIQSSAQMIRRDLERREGKFEKELNMSNEIINSSEELAEFIGNMIELNQGENVELKIDKDDQETDILKIVKRSVKLLETIADNSNIKLIEKIEDTLHKLSEIEPQKVKQIIINLVPQNSKDQKETELKTPSQNANDNESRRA